MFSNHRGWIFLGLLSLIFLILGEATLGRQGLILGFLLASALNTYVYFISEKLILQFYNPTAIEGQDPWGVSGALAQTLDHFQNLPIQAYITKINTPISLCSSRGWGTSKIIISESLLNKLTPEEISDLIKIHSRYLLSNSSFFIGFRTQFSEITFIVSRFLDTVLSLPLIIFQKPKRIQFFQKILTPLGIVFYNSQREALLKNDQEIAELLGSPERYARLLWKLQGLIESKPFPIPPSPAVLFLVNPLASQTLSLYFSRHFEIETRIKALVGHYPI